MSTAAPILSGTLSELDLQQLMQLTSLGRRLMRVEVASPGGDPIGNVVVKAGRIVEATAGQQRGRAALRTLLGTERSARFTILHETHAVSTEFALAMVDELEGLIAPALAGEARRTRRSNSELEARRSLIIEGLLSEFDLPTLLQTVGEGRGTVSLEVLEHDEPIGRLMLKAGMLLQVEAGDLQGLLALRKLMKCPGHCQFRVFRMLKEGSDIEPLCSINTALMDVVFETTGELELRMSHGPSPIPAAEQPLPPPIPPLPAILARSSKQLPVFTPAPVIDRRMPEEVMPAEPRAPMPVTAPPPAAPRAAGTAAQRAPLLAGSLAGIGIRNLLGSLVENRQHIAVELSRGEVMAGELRLKAGKLLSVTAGTAHGLPAFSRILELPEDCGFIVCRLMTAVSLPEQPLGNLAELLETAPAHAHAPVVVEPAPEPARPALIEPLPASPPPSEAVAVHPAERRRRGPWLGLGLGAVAVVSLVMFFAMRGTEQPATAPVAPRAEAPAPPAAVTPAPAPSVATPTPAAAVKPPPVAVRPPSGGDGVAAADATAPPVARPARVKVITIRYAQTLLNKLGYPVRPGNHIHGRRTKQAIAAFQRDQHLEETAHLNAETTEALLRRASAASR